MAASATGVAIPATSILGSNPQASGGGWGNWCLAAMQNLLQIPMQFGNAASAFYGYKAKGFQVGAPLPGDMAFYGPSAGNGGQGHVGTDNGDGTYTSVLSDGKFHVLPLTSTSLGAPLLGFISSTKAGAINQFAALGKLKDRIGGVTNSGGTVTTGTATNYGGGTGDLLNPAPAPSIGDPMNPPRPAGTYTSGTCPPTPPNWDDSKYHPDIPLVGGAAGPLVFLADQIAYFGTYAVCALTAVVKFVTTPGYWWRLLFVLAGVGLVVVGGKTYLAGDLPQVLQSVGK